MKQSPLSSVHAGVPEFLEWSDMRLPARFGDIESEYEVLNSSAGAVDVSGTGVLRISGKDAEDYLHRMLSNSVKDLQPGSCNHTTLLRGDGRMIGDALCCRVDTSDFLLISSRFAVTGLREQLERLIIMEDVELRDLTDRSFAVELIGPKAGDAAAAVASGFDPTRHKSVFSDGEQSVIRFDRFALPQYLVIGPAASAEDVWRRAEATDCVARVGLLAYEALRIESGIPLYGRDMDQSTIPLEANLYDAVDFTKGCFPGQEIVARINNLGHPANRLVGWLADDNSEVSAESGIRAADAVTGKVTSVSPRPLNGKAYGLGYVKWNHREPGIALTLSGPNGQTVPAQVIVFPNVSTDE